MNYTILQLYSHIIILRKYNYYIFTFSLRYFIWIPFLWYFKWNGYLLKCNHKCCLNLPKYIVIRLCPVCVNYKHIFRLKKKQMKNQLSYNIRIKKCFLSLTLKIYVSFNRLHSIILWYIHIQLQIDHGFC